MTTIDIDSLPPAKPKKYLKPANVAEQLQISVRNVQDLFNAKKLNGFRVGKLWRCEQVDVDDYIARARKGEV